MKRKKVHLHLRTQPLSIMKLKASNKCKQIKEFIKELSSCDTLIDFDREFLKSFSDQFDLVSEDAVLDETQIKWLLDVFASRWKLVADTALDYTFNPGDSNACWVKLAKALAEKHKMSYLQILFPTIENTIDPILLNELTDCSELRGFYVSQDQKYLHRVRGLFERVQSGHHFSSFKTPSDTSAKALTLMELTRIQSKRGDDLTFDFEKVDYLNFWDYLKRAVMPTWRVIGEYPFSLLASLLEVSEGYFTRSSQGFKKLLRSWELILQESPVKKINALYGQVIQVSDQNFYLVEILIEMMSGDCSREKILGLVDWITQNDPSLVSKLTVFDNIYKDKAVGPYFTIKELGQYVSMLEDCRTQRGVRQLALLVQRTKVKSEIDQELVALVRDVYQERWLKIMGGSKDYTRLQGGVNNTWIRLAQILAGAGIIPENYYRFLMPTLTHDNDPVQLEALTKFPLSHFILSEDARQLILLENSALRYKVTKTFYNCNPEVAKVFSRVELERITFAHKKYQKYLQNMRITFETEDLGVFLNTVMAVRALVDGSLYPAGLIFSYDYNATQMASAARAYQVFYKFLHDLPDEELQRLETQRIFFHDAWYTFGEILLKIKEGECIAVYGQYFAQFVMDYAPYVRFRPEIETQVGVEVMRVDSRKKVVREYDYLTEDEALRRLHMLFVSIMTHPFQYVTFAGYTESHWGYKNIMPHEAAAILKKLIPALEARNSKDTRFLYVHIVEGTVKPLLSSDTYYNRATRYSDTKIWLKSIVDGTLFTKPRYWYEPEVLMASLLPMLEINSPLQSKIEGFLDKAVNLVMRGSSHSTNLHVNMRFMQFLKSLDSKNRSLVLKQVNQQGKVEHSQLTPLCVQVMRLKIANLYAYDVSTPSYGLFRRRPNRRAYEEAIEAITVEGSSLQQMQDLVHDLLLQFRISDDGAKSISQYWQRTTGRSLEKPQPSYYVFEPHAQNFR